MIENRLERVVPDIERDDHRERERDRDRDRDRDTHHTRRRRTDP